MERTRRVLREAVETGGIPSASLAVIVGGEERLSLTLGLARLSPPREALPDQVYDLASLTKAIVGAPLVACALEAGALSPDTRIADVLDGLDPRVTLRHLLDHTSGLPAFLPLHERLGAPWGSPRARREILDRARAVPLASPPGAAHVYSDLGFLVLTDLLEAVTGRRLDALYEERIARPAGMVAYGWGWPGAAATERCLLRGRLLEGEVHDPNASAMGGVSAHAGLFASAREIAGLGWRLLRAARGEAEGTGLPGRGMRALWAMRGTGAHRGGWDTVESARAGESTRISATGRHFPPDTIGHLGYTGTSLWIAPSRDTVVAFLTNRIHPVDDKTAIRAVRPRVHDAVAQDLGWA